MTPDAQSLAAWLMMLIQAFYPDLTEQRYQYVETQIALALDILLGIGDLLNGPVDADDDQP